MTRAPAQTTDFSRLLVQIQRRTEPLLRRALTRSRREAKPLGPEVTDLVDAVQSLSLRGGKRLRPALLWVGAHAAPGPVRGPARSTARSRNTAHREGAPTENSLLQFGVALELMQAYFLIHDDWMDGDEERRGGPTAHVALTRALGSPFLGERSAILAGDLALALAQRQVAELDVPCDRLVTSLRDFAEMQTAAVYGQQLDIVGRTEDPELTYALKTASYTVLGPLRVGASLAGAPAATRAALTRFSAPAGIAFQLRDDLIGVFGDPEKTGKPRGGDLRAGKRTWMLVQAQREATPAQRRLLTRVLGRRDAPTADLEAALGVLERTR
ncbi:MAG TPA: polyprenyl synthetase family protein, partial [Polyangiaceae bacterium]|nr:polyprenyl synthetase family protein [Polyangiaceae bacterium]